MQQGNLFELRDVAVAGEDGDILDGVNLDVATGGITSVVGPSGAGKTTLLRVLNRLEAGDSGTVTFRGEPIDGVDPLALRRDVGMVFQRPALFGGTVLDNIRVADPEATAERAGELLERAELTADFVDREASSLSGGEAQRMCIARALAAGPEALLMDEPTASVDAALRRGLERLAVKLADQGLTVVWVSHDLEQVRRIADRVAVIIGGRMRYSGTVGGLDAADDALVRRYLAEAEHGR